MYYEKILNFLGDWRVQSWLLVAGIVLMGSLIYRTRQLADHTSLDEEKWLTRADIDRFFNDNNADQIRCYALSECTLDLAFPFVYTGLLCGLMFSTCSCWLPKWACFAPVLLMICDLLENTHFVAFCWNQSLIATYYGSACFFHNVKCILSIPAYVGGPVMIAIRAWMMWK